MPEICIALSGLKTFKPSGWFDESLEYDISHSLVNVRSPLSLFSRARAWTSLAPVTLTVSVADLRQDSYIFLVGSDFISIPRGNFRFLTNGHLLTWTVRS